jgi:hypothetical protein
MAAHCIICNYEYEKWLGAKQPCSNRRKHHQWSWAPVAKETSMNTVIDRIYNNGNNFLILHNSNNSSNT